MLIYRIKFPNGKTYIGATTKSLEDRKKSHLTALSSSDYPVHLALRKHKDRVIWKVLAKCSSLDELQEKERYFIIKYTSLTKDNGYNVKPGGFYITGTHGKTLSEKRKEYFSNKDNRIKHAIKHGAESFIVYDLINRTIVGEWINQRIAAEELNIKDTALNNVLTGTFFLAIIIIT